MDCERACALIDGFVGDELSTDDARALADHLRGCPACSAEMAGASRLIELLATLPDVPPTPDFDERVLLAALEDRRRRHEHRNWLGDLRTQILRGTLRTTGTFVATVLVVASLAVGGVWAAYQLVPGLPLSARVVQQTSHPTLAAPTGTPITPAAGVQTTPTAAPTPSPRVIVITVTPAPTPSPTPSPSPSPSPTATPAPTPAVTPNPTPSPSASATPTATPTPSPTPKPRRCPPGTACYSPSPTPGAASPSSP